MPQLRKLAYAIKNSSTLALPEWFCILDELSLDACMIPHDVRTRWNATYDMLNFTYEYKEAINQITDRCEMKLRDYEIEPHEWDIIKQLWDILGIRPSMFKSFFDLSYIPSQVFKDATLFFSCGGTSNVASVIPAMDHLDEHLASIATSLKYGRPIKAAVALGKKTLNRYYDRMDHSEVYRIAMSMFPFIPPTLKYS